MGFLPVGQAGLEPPTTGDPPTLASQSAGMTDMTTAPSLFLIIAQWALTLSPRLEFSDVITVYCSLNLPGSSSPPTPASRVAETKEMKYHYVTQAGPKLVDLSDLPTSSSQSVGITGMNHHTHPQHIFKAKEREQERK
ncbi:hypothetical protein AAY473_024258, partial [Plecturocebus cupreus]